MRSIQSEQIIDPSIMGKQPATAYEGYLDVALECAIRVKG